MLPKQRLLHAAFFCPSNDGTWRGLPIYLISKPGGAKTSVVKQFAKYVQYPCKIAAVGAKGEGFFGCTPVKIGSESAPRIGYPVPFWTDEYTECGLVCVDEWTTAKGEVKPATATLILEGEIADHVLAPRVRVWATGNPIECSIDGEPLSPPNANRVCHIDWKMPSDAVRAYFGNCGATIEPIDGAAEEKRVLALWPKAFSIAGKKIAAFLTRRPDFEEKMPEQGDPNLHRAWPSLRSWELAQRVLATSEVHDLGEEDRDTLGAGCVGEAAWAELLTYLSTLDLPDPVALLDGQIKWAPDTRRIDIAAVTLDACVALVTPTTQDTTQRVKRATALWHLLDQASQLGLRDLTQSAQASLIKAGLMAPCGGIANKVLAESRTSGLQAAIQGTK